MSNQYTKADSVITDEQFEQVSELICTKYGIYKACKEIGISTRSYYEYKRSNPSAEKRHADNKWCRTEYLLNKIDDLTEQCKDEIRTISDPKRCTALQRAYETEIASIREIIKKLNATEYGDKLDITTNNQSLTREIVLTAPAVKKVSINQKARETNNNDNVSC